MYCSCMHLKKITKSGIGFCLDHVTEYVPCTAHTAPRLPDRQVLAC